MEDLIKALQILSKYTQEKYPTGCEHDVLYVIGVNIDDVSEEDLVELENLSFKYDDEEDNFYSFRFGSC